MSNIKITIKAAAVLILSAAIFSSSGWASDLKLDTDGRDLFLKTESAPLSLILNQLSARTEFAIWTAGSIDEMITADFNHIPLEKGLAKLLRNYDYAFEFTKGPGDQKPIISVIYILSKTGNQSSALAWNPEDRLNGDPETLAEHSTIARDAASPGFREKHIPKSTVFDFAEKSDDLARNTPGPIPGKASVHTTRQWNSSHSNQVTDTNPVVNTNPVIDTNPVIENLSSSLDNSTWYPETPQESEIVTLQEDNGILFTTPIPGIARKPRIGMNAIDPAIRFMSEISTGTEDLDTSADSHEQYLQRGFVLADLP